MMVCTLVDEQDNSPFGFLHFGQYSLEPFLTRQWYLCRTSAPMSSAKMVLFLSPSDVALDDAGEALRAMAVRPRPPHR